MAREKKKLKISFFGRNSHLWGGGGSTGPALSQYVTIRMLFCFRQPLAADDEDERAGAMVRPIFIFFPFYVLTTFTYRMIETRGGRISPRIEISRFRGNGEAGIHVRLPVVLNSFV